MRRSEPRRDYARARTRSKFLRLDGATIVKSEVRQRSQVVAVRMTPDEHDRYAALAARMGRSLPDLMRLAVEAALLDEQTHIYARRNA